MTESPTVSQLVAPLEEVSSSTLKSVIDRQDPFPERLEKILNGPYVINMRRSVQTCVLFEADRCLRSRYNGLKPFQRKVALFETASDIVGTLSFIPAHYRIEIMYRTNTGKFMLTSDLAWRRMKLIDREIKKTIIPKIKALDEAGKTHDELCDLYLQKEYEKSSGKKNPHHKNWEYTHDNHFTAYRMFYLGDSLNPNLPPAIDPNPNRVVPDKKPTAEDQEAESRKRQERSAAMVLQTKKATPTPNKKQKVTPVTVPIGSCNLNSTTTKEAKNDCNDPTERRALLKEIKDHIEILNEFKGIIPEIELIERKKVLFDRLPSP